MTNILLEAKNVGKDFSGNQVLKDVNFTMKEGEILGLVGENGAGKSTLMNIIFGMSVIADTGGYEGEITLNGQPLNFKNPTEALKAGIGMVHQEFNLIPGFTVAENITLDMEKTKPSIISTIFGKKLETIDKKANIVIAGESLDTLGMNIDPNANVSDMPVGHKQFIEIAREITREDVKLIIMDEPTAVLTETEADMLLESMKRLSSMGIAIIFISHRLRETLEVCDNIMVLRDGVLVENMAAENYDVEKLASLMVGRESQKKEVVEEDPRKIDPEDLIMEIEDLVVDMPGETVRRLSLKIRKGEILGIAGLAGQGKLGLPNGILGIYPAKGRVKYKDQDLEIGKTYDILKKGIGFVSEDRRGVGLLLDEPIYWNIGFNAMHIQEKFTKKVLGLSFRDEDAMEEVAKDYIQSLAIRTTGPGQKARNLSGGNQQKVCLAKAFAMEPDLLFVSEPTRGIDIGAKALVLDSLKKTNREDGTTVVMVSSELEELKSICDRIAVICEGKITGILSPDASNAKFGLLMSGESLEEDADAN